MEERARCQSCGIPLDVGYYGTNEDFTINMEYCKYCYENGNFREPNLTLGEMMGRSIAKMIDENQMTESEAKATTSSTIPQLKRWNKFTN